MITYIGLMSFTEKGIQSVKDTTRRAADAKEIGKKFGVNMREIYWTLGECDLVCVMEAEDEASLAAFNLATSMRGNIRTRSLRAFTAREMDQVIAKLPWAHYIPLIRVIDWLFDAAFEVDYGERDGKSMLSTAVALVAEVLSPSTRFLDFNKKLDDYKSVPTLKTILLFEQDAPRVHLFRREQDNHWAATTLEGLDATINLPELGLSLALATLYERIQFPFRPTLIEPV